jgi:hypothetical protein
MSHGKCPAAGPNGRALYVVLMLSGAKHAVWRHHVMLVTCKLHLITANLRNYGVTYIHGSRWLANLWPLTTLQPSTVCRPALP